MEKNEYLNCGGGLTLRRGLRAAASVIIQLAVVAAAIIGVIWFAFWLMAVPGDAQDSWLPRNSCEWSQTCQQQYRYFNVIRRP